MFSLPLAAVCTDWMIEIEVHKKIFIVTIVMCKEQRVFITPLIPYGIFPESIKHYIWTYHYINKWRTIGWILPVESDQDKAAISVLIVP